MQRWKSWLAAASALLLVGAGCPQTARIEIKTGVEAPAGAEKAGKENGGAKSEVDASADAFIGAAADENAAAEEEEKDASSLDATSAEINAYGQTYDKNEF